MNPTRLFSHHQAKRFYDRFGARLDTQAFYEFPALQVAMEHLQLETSRAVVEFGCGTGRLAAALLETRLRPEATYLGLDISETMVALTKHRLARYGRRAEVRQSDGSPRIDSKDNSFDRFVSSYVLDLLPGNEIQAVLQEAHRVLVPGGMLGLVSLTNGPTLMSRLMSMAWRGLHAISPWLVGGCRPVELMSYVSPPEWKLEHRRVLVAFAVPSEIVVARALPFIDVGGNPRIAGAVRTGRTS